MDMKAPIRVETMAPLMALTLVIHRPKCRKSGSAFISSPTANDQPPAPTQMARNMKRKKINENEKDEKKMVNVNSVFSLMSSLFAPFYKSFHEYFGRQKEYY